MRNGSPVLYRLDRIQKLFIKFGSLSSMTTDQNDRYYTIPQIIFAVLFICRYKSNTLRKKMNTVRNRLVIAFTVAWIAYALTYFLRKPLGVVSCEKRS